MTLSLDGGIDTVGGSGEDEDGYVIEMSLW